MEEALELVRARLWATLPFKDEGAWQRLLESEHRAALDTFLAAPAAARLLIYAEGKELVATTKPPAKLRKRTAYFLKLPPTTAAVKGRPTAAPDDAPDAKPGPASDLSDRLIAGELSDAPLDQLAALSSSVFLPLIRSAVRGTPGAVGSQAALPEVVAKGLSDGLQRFVASVTVAAGQLRNQTLLPLPPVSEGELGSETPEPDTVRALEAALAIWSRQMRAVLATDPDAPLKAASSGAAPHPGPLAELDYWVDRAAQLASICEQLGRERPRACIAALARARSTYLPAFQRLATEAEEAAHEAADCCRFLNPLRKLFAKLNVMVSVGGQNMRRKYLPACICSCSVCLMCYSAASPPPEIGLHLPRSFLFSLPCAGRLPRLDRPVQAHPAHTTTGLAALQCLGQHSALGGPPARGLQ